MARVRAQGSRLRARPRPAGTQGGISPLQSGSFVSPENKALRAQPCGEATPAAGVDPEELLEGPARRAGPRARPLEGNCEIVSELVAASAQKGQLRKKRLSELGITQADDTLMSQGMFVAIAENQFKWNGKGSFGTFLF